MACGLSHIRHTGLSESTHALRPPRRDNLRPRVGGSSVVATRRAYRHIPDFLLRNGFPVKQSPTDPPWAGYPYLHSGARSANLAPCLGFRSKTFPKPPTASCGSERRARISPYRNTFAAL